MIKTSLNLSQVKKGIEKMLKKEVDVTLNLGRNKFVSFTATLTASSVVLTIAFVKLMLALFAAFVAALIALYHDLAIKTGHLFAPLCD